MDRKITMWEIKVDLDDDLIPKIKEMALREIAADDQALLNYGVSLALRRAVGLEKNGGRTCRRPRSSTSRSS